MFKNSNELLDYVLRELKKVVNEVKPIIVLEVVLKPQCSGTSDERLKTIDSLELKKLTDILREKHPNYEITSSAIIRKYKKSKLSLNLKKGCVQNPYDETVYYSLIWEIALRRK